MAYILNIETATDICSVAISSDIQLCAVAEITGNEHTAQLTILIEKCLKEAGIKLSDLTAVAVSNGPGSYTSLRVGVSTAKGICYAMGLPLLAIDTLEILAHAAYTAAPDPAALYCPMIDARRMEVYCALYQFDNRKTVCLQPMQAEIIDEHSFKTYFDEGQKIVFVGNGAPKTMPILTSPLAHYQAVLCSAAYMPPLSMSHFLEKKYADLAYHTPEYLKAPNITTPKKNF